MTRPDSMFLDECPPRRTRSALPRPEDVGGYFFEPVHIRVEGPDAFAVASLTGGIVSSTHRDAVTIILSPHSVSALPEHHHGAVGRLVLHGNQVQRVIQALQARDLVWEIIDSPMIHPEGFRGEVP